VFFDNHRELCIPKDTAPENRSKYLLARAVILRHLSINLPAIQPKILVQNFPSLQSDAFVDYLSSESVYFVMCSDGALQSSEQKKMFRWMIYWFIEHGYNAALINSLEFLDTKVMSMVLESPKLQATEADIAAPDGLPANANGKIHHNTHTAEKLVTIQENAKLQLSEREILTVLVLAQIYQDDQSIAKIISLFLLHTTCLKYYSMGNRRFKSVEDAEDGFEMIQNFAALAYERLQEESMVRCLAQSPGRDLADLIDARLFYTLCKEESEQKSLAIGNSEVHRHYSALLGVLSNLCGTKSIPAIDLQDVTEVVPTGDTNADTTVMSFSNPVFDLHLAPIHLRVDPTLTSESSRSNKIFSELTHWHNAKPVQRKGITPKVGWWVLRRNQYFMAEMIAYAASLTNASGKVLDPEVIIASGNAKSSGKMPIMSKNDQKPVKKEGKEAKPGKKGGPVKKGGKQAALEAAAAVKASKVDQQEMRIFQAWEGVIRDLQKIIALEVRYSKAKKYLNGLSARDVSAIGAEVELFMIGLLLELWAASQVEQNGHVVVKTEALSNKTPEYAALIWDHATHLLRSPDGLTKNVATNINDILQILGLPSLPYRTTIERKLPFTLRALEASKRSSKKTGTVDLSLHMDPRDFQLSHCGPYFDRSIDSAPDARVAFQVSFVPD
jgi:hypothetical protein